MSSKKRSLVIIETPDSDVYNQILKQLNEGNKRAFLWEYKEGSEIYGDIMEIVWESTKK